MGAVLGQLVQRHPAGLEHYLQGLGDAVGAQLLDNRAVGAGDGADKALPLQHPQGLPDGGAASLEHLDERALRGQAVPRLELAGDDEILDLLIDGLAGPLGLHRAQGRAVFRGRGAVHGHPSKTCE